MPTSTSSAYPVAARGAAGWPAALLACVAVVAVAMLAIAFARPYLTTGTLAATATLINQGARRNIATWGAGYKPEGHLTGVVFGDSVLAPLTSKKRFVTAFAPALEAVGLHASVLNLTQAGFSAFQFYYLVNDVIAAGPPDFAVVEVNVRTFAPDWYEDPGERLTVMATGLTTAQVWRVRQALATQQIGMLSPYLLRVDQWLGMSMLFDVARNLGVTMLDAAGRRANTMLGLSVRPQLDLTREAIARRVLLTPEHAQLWYERDYVSSPTGQVLRAFTEQLRAAGVRVLFLLAPVQKQTLRTFAISRASFDARIDALRRALGATPEEWIDAAFLFQTDDFADGMHLQPDMIRRMAGPVAERVASLFAAQPTSPAAAAGSLPGRPLASEASQ